MIFPSELTSVLLAAGLSPFFVFIHVFLFRRRAADSPGYAQLLPAAGVYFISWLGLFALYMGRFLGVTEAVAGGATIGFVVLAYMQVFSLTCRGFSLRILVEIDRLQSLDLDGIVREYSDGRGLDWLMEKRLAAMEKIELIRRDEHGHLEVCGAGLLAGRMGILTKRFLHLGLGG